MLKKLPFKLPLYLHRFFWDTNAKKVNPQKQPVYIAKRLLDRGDLRAICWLFKYYGKKELKNIFQNSREISQFSRPLWTAYFKTKSIDSLCISEEFPQPLKTAWPY